jgi:hypothetical protein
MARITLLRIIVLLPFYFPDSIFVNSDNPVFRENLSNWTKN